MGWLERANLNDWADVLPGPNPNKLMANNPTRYPRYGPFPEHAARHTAPDRNRAVGDRRKTSARAARTPGSRPRHQRKKALLCVVRGLRSVEPGSAWTRFVPSSEDLAIWQVAQPTEVLFFYSVGSFRGAAAASSSPPTRDARRLHRRHTRHSRDASRR